MALSDPQTITIGGVTSSLPRVSTQGNKSLYTSADGLITLSLAHAGSNRIRRVVRVDHAKITADPFIPAQNRRVSMSNYIVFDVPSVGYTLAEAQAVWTGFKTQVTASSDALIVALLGGQS